MKRKIAEWTPLVASVSLVAALLLTVMFGFHWRIIPGLFGPWPVPVPIPQ